MYIRTKEQLSMSSSLPVLYAMLTDDMFRVPQRVSKQDTITLGTLEGEARNYLVNLTKLEDTRRRRLTILNSSAPYGSMSLLFDANRFNVELLDSLTDIQHNLLFNIIERVVLQQSYRDTDIEYQLVGNTEYAGYVQSSLMTSPSSTTATILNYNKDEIDDVPFKDWCGFDFSVSDRNGNDISFRLHIWINSTVFASSYPYTTITNVVPPYDVATLINPVNLLQEANLAVLQTGSVFIFDKMDSEAVTRDQNGIYTYRTKYILDGNRSIQLPFALPYCGARIPSGLECRKAIKNYLLSNPSMTDDILKALFPELYVTSRFFIIPLWNVYQSTTERDIYTSIVNYTRMKTCIRKIFPDMDSNYLDTYMEVILNAQNTTISISIPDELNEGLWNIASLYPTYQNYSTSMPGYRFMTSDTQEFAGKLNRCMSVINGEAVSDEFTATNVEGFTYYTFTTDTAEFLVMTKASYMEYMKNIGEV